MEKWLKNMTKIFSTEAIRSADLTFQYEALIEEMEVLKKENYELESELCDYKKESNFLDKENQTMR